MGKDWDSFNEVKDIKNEMSNTVYAKKGFNKLPRNKPFGMIEFFVPIWKECLRTLKPGAFAFVMCAPRQDTLCRQITALSEAGFDVGFSSIYWTFSSGFPKSINISLAVDKRECKRLLQEKLNREPTNREFEEEWKNFRIKIAKNPNERPNSNPEDNTLYHYGSTGKVFGITEPRTSQAKELEGSFGGFQPKPAVEIIIVAMKPLREKTYVDQALKNKKGITWFDDCRIPYDKLPKNITRNNQNTKTILNKGFEGEAKTVELSLDGRFPANLLVSDDVLNVPSKGALAPVKSGQKGFGGVIYGKYKSGGDDGQSFYSDKEISKSYSRYFDLDIWFEKQFEKLPENIRKIFPLLVVPKAAKSEKNKGLIGSNLHPTVKPLKLFSYLITLGSRENDVVLDPFLGSGTTAIAAKMLKRKYIGIELSKEYYDIAQKRLAVVEKELF